MATIINRDEWLSERLEVLKERLQTLNDENDPDGQQRCDIEQEIHEIRLDKAD